jgi:plastocyanin
MKRRLRYGGSLMVLAIVLSLAAAACSSDSTTSTGDGGATTPPASPSASPTADQGGGSGGGGGGNSASIEAGANGFVFTPSTVSIAEGGKLTVKNAGTVPHTFTIQSNGINEVMQPGQSAKITISLAPGTYPFVCTFHQSSGMTGMLTVT